MYQKIMPKRDGKFKKECKRPIKYHTDDEFVFTTVKQFYVLNIQVSSVVARAELTWL